ncbi:extensin family protein [Rhodobacteraceae bacterium NNCM2]|nr:extensin family protein [Coraliihabitans acroporae]
MIPVLALLIAAGLGTVPQPHPRPVITTEAAADKVAEPGAPAKAAPGPATPVAKPQRDPVEIVVAIAAPAIEAAEGAATAEAPAPGPEPVAAPEASPPAVRQPVAKPVLAAVALPAAPAPAESTDKAATDSAAPAATPARKKVPRPVARPARALRFVQPAAAMQPYSQPRQSSGLGMVCDDPRLMGVTREDIISASMPCGIRNPVRVEEIAGIRLSSPATLNCPTARRFADWLTGIADPAAKREFGVGIRGVWVMGSYACRTRNNRIGARISEHAKGRAVDVGGVTLKNGERITVKQDWSNGAKGRFLKKTHKSACGMFHTVLGPGSDGYHDDHFHFDTAQRGGNPYCR